MADICSTCKLFPPAVAALDLANKTARLAAGLTRDIKTLSGMVKDEHAQQAMMLSQSAADQAAQLADELEAFGLELEKGTT